MREGNALGDAGWALDSFADGVAFGGIEAGVFEFHPFFGVLLRAQEHGSLGAETDVYDLRAADYVQGLVAMLADVIVAVAVIL